MYSCDKFSWLPEHYGSAPDFDLECLSDSISGTDFKLINSLISIDLVLECKKDTPDTNGISLSLSVKPDTFCQQAVEGCCRNQTSTRRREGCPLANDQQLCN